MVVERPVNRERLFGMVESAAHSHAGHDAARDTDRAERVEPVGVLTIWASSVRGEFWPKTVCAAIACS